MMTSVTLEERKGCVGYKLDQGLSLSVIQDANDKIEKVEKVCRLLVEMNTAIDLFYSKSH